MLSCEVQFTRSGALNFDHWLANCRFAFCSSLMQFLIDWSTERPAVAATSSLQLRAISNFGTPSATGMTSCEPNTIIEIEIGIFRPPPDLARQYRSGSFPGRQYYLDAAAPFHARSDRSTDRRSIPFSPCGRRCLREAKADEGSFSAERNPSPALSYKGRGKELRLVAAFLAAGFEQEPGAALGLVDEDFEQARGAGILMIIAKLVGLAHRGRHVLVVFHQFTKHFARRHVALIVVLDGLQFSDLPDRAHRGAADLANALGQLIGGRENRVGLLVEHQMIVAEMPAADVPVKILGLHIKREGVSQQRVERRRNLVYRGLRQIGRRIEIGRDFVGLGFAHDEPSC